MTLPSDLSSLPQELRAPLLAFDSRQLPQEDWTHECHLRVATAAYLLLEAAGTAYLSQGIQRLNETHGVPQTTTGGYHETLTRVWFWLVSQAVDQTGLRQHPHDLDRIETLLQELSDKSLPLSYYSRARLLSWEARISWVEPDLQPLK